MFNLFVFLLILRFKCVASLDIRIGNDIALKYHIKFIIFFQKQTNKNI